MADFESHEFKLDSLNHIGLVVKDCDATMEAWSSLLGIGPWTVRADFLNTHGEGLHHICARVGDVDAAVAKLVAEGGEVMVSTPGVFAYVNIGGPGSVILELLKTPA